jgi:hypothetical protein
LTQIFDEKFNLQLYLHSVFEHFDHPVVQYLSHANNYGIVYSLFLSNDRISEFNLSFNNCYTSGKNSVADPDPNPDPNPDPHVFEPSGSGSISQRYGSGSFYHHAKIVRKP